MIKFVSAHIEGFGSFQYPTKFNFGNGLNLVKGSNGHGKTTLFSALFWALYQMNLKEVANAKVATWKKIRTEDFRGTRVVIDFFDGGDKFRIARHLDFKGTTSGYKGGSSLLVFKNEELINEKLHKGDVQDYINDLLGMNPKVFLNSVLFGQRMVRLIQSKENEKRELFEELFEVSFIPAAKERAKVEAEKLQVKLSKAESDLSANDREIKTLSDGVADKEKAIEEWQEQHDTRINTIKARLTTARESLKTEKTKLGVLTKKKADKKPADLAKEIAIVAKANQTYDALKAECTRLGKKVSDCEDEFNRSMRIVTNLNRDLETVKDKCPTCLQDLPKAKVEDVKKELRKQILAENKVVLKMKGDKEDAEADLRKKDGEMKTAWTDLEVKYKDLTDKRKAAGEGDTTDSDIAVCNSRIEQFEENIANANIDLKSEERAEKPAHKLDKDKAKIAELKEDNKAVEAKVNEISESKTHYDWWNTKGFNSGGLKAFVFDSMLNKLNEAITRYASRLGTLVRFSVDLSKASKPFKTEVIDADGDEVDYQELSGGQKQRIDICLAFAMFDIISINKATNLMILDEVLEGLDDEGVEQVFDLLREKSGPEMAVYLITHQNNVDTHASREILIEADKYSSYING